MAISTIPSAAIATDTIVATDIADDAIGTAELANDVVISTSGNITTTGKLSTPSMVQTDAQNLTGTYSTHELIMGKTFTLTGDVTVNENLILSNMSGVGTNVTIQPDSTARTITSTGGTGILEGGEMLGTNNDLTGMTGTLGSVVTGGSGLTSIGTATDGSNLTSLGTVTAGNLSNTAIVYPAGHIVKVTPHVSTADVFQDGLGITAEADANDITVTCVAGNKLHIWIVGGFGFSLGTTNDYFSYGVRIIDSGTTDIDVGSLYSRGNTYMNDTTPSVMYTHTAVTTSVTIKRFAQTHGDFANAWYRNDTEGVRYLIMEEQV